MITRPFGFNSVPVIVTFSSEHDTTYYRMHGLGLGGFMEYIYIYIELEVMECCCGSLTTVPIAGDTNYEVDFEKPKLLVHGAEQML